MRLRELTGFRRGRQGGLEEGGAVTGWAGSDAIRAINVAGKRMPQRASRVQTALAQRPIGARSQ